VHSVKTKRYQNVFVFDRRNESCFCSICIEDIESDENCENKIGKYVKSWNHAEINTKGKMPLSNIEDMESNDTTMLTNGYRVFDLVREGKMLQLFKNIIYVETIHRCTCYIYIYIT